MSAADALIDCQEECAVLRARVCGLDGMVQMAEAALGELAERNQQMRAVREAVTQITIQAGKADAEGRVADIFEMPEFGSLLRIVFHNDIPKLIAKAIAMEAK